LAIRIDLSAKQRLRKLWFEDGFYLIRIADASLKRTPLENESLLERVSALPLGERL
jgi:hypothetical protein